MPVEIAAASAIETAYLMDPPHMILKELIRKPYHELIAKVRAETARAARARVVEIITKANGGITTANGAGEPLDKRPASPAAALQLRKAARYDRLEEWRQRF